MFHTRRPKSSLSDRAVVSRQGWVSASAVAGESTSDEALPSRQEFVEHVPVVIAAGVCGSDQRITS